MMIIFLTIIQSCNLLILALQDMKRKEVSTLLLLFLFGSVLVDAFLKKDVSFLERLFAFFVGGGMLLLMNLFQKNSVGSGDIYCISIMGFYYGIYDLFIFMSISYFLAFFYSIYLSVYKKASNKTQIPMFPFFYIAHLCTLLCRI